MRLFIALSSAESQILSETGQKTRKPSAAFFTTDIRIIMNLRKAIVICEVSAEGSVYIIQQFKIFNENVEKASLFLSEAFIHKLFNTNVVILYKMYTIPRISG